MADHPLIAVRRALVRFDETTSDCGETDLPRDVLDGLVAFGYLTKRRAGRHGFCYTMTEAGHDAVQSPSTELEALRKRCEALRAEVERLNKVLGPVSAEAIEMRHFGVAQRRRAEQLAEACRDVEEAWAGNGDMATAVDKVLLALHPTAVQKGASES